MVAAMGLLSAVILVGLSVTAADPQTDSVPQLCSKAAAVLQLYSLSTASDSQQSAGCDTMNIMQNLGCFCDGATQREARNSITPDILATLQACQESQDADLDSRCNSKFPGPQPVPGIPEIMSVPGLGFVTTAALDAHLDMLMLQITEPAPPADFRDAVTVTKEGDEFVLDLSQVADEAEMVLDVDGEVAVLGAEVARKGDTIVLDVDLDVPDYQLEDGLDITMEITQDEDSAPLVLTMSLDMEDMEEMDTEVVFEFETDTEAEDLDLIITADEADEVDLAIDVEGELAEFSFNVDDPRLALVRSLPEAEETDVVVEVDVDLPQDLVNSLGISDVTIEMEVDVHGQATISETAITIENGEDDLPMTGLGLGQLLIDAADYLYSVLPASPGPKEEPSETDEVTSILGSAVQMLSELGEEISLAIPHTPLLDGDTIEIMIEETTLPELPEGEVGCGSMKIQGAPQLAARRAMDTLTQAVKSAMYFQQAEVEGRQQAACTICKYVQKHVQLLWTVVQVNTVLLALCCVYFVYRAFARPASHTPTVPESDLCKPLIVNAADYASPDEKEFVLAPVWAPAAGKLGAL